MFPMLLTRLDVAFVVGKLLRYASNPTTAYYNCFIRLLRYLCLTIDYGVEFHSYAGKEDLEMLGKIAGFVDADYANCLDTRRSTTGYLFMIANGPISWLSKLQSTVTMSTCEAEYNAISMAGREAIWLIYLLELIGLGGVRPMVLYTDSETAMKLAENFYLSTRSKYIDITVHWIREALYEGKL